MKNTRKGFTLIELVIVIAVIAILAGVIIGTFATVLNRAKETAKVQQIKNDEIAQKADDIIAKIENSNWFGWEDFEADLVAKLTEVYKTNSSASLTSEEIKKAVNEAVTTAIANINVENTGLTVDDVKAVVENALGTLKYEGVTEAQVRAIVNAAANTLAGTQLSAAQVRAIVVAANEKNLTAAQVAQIIAGQGLAGQTDVSSAVTTITNALSTATANVATKEQVETLQETVDQLVQNTIEADDVITAKALNIKIAKAGLTTTNVDTPYDVVSVVGLPNNSRILFDLDNVKFFVIDDEGKVYNNCGLTLTLGAALTDAYKYWVFDTDVSTTYSTYLTGASYTTVPVNGVGVDVGDATVSAINYTDTVSDKTVVIRTNSFDTTLTINTDGSVKHFGNVGVVDIAKVAMESFHEYGNVRRVKLTQGNLEVEKNATVTLVTVTATVADTAKVKVDGTVTTYVAKEDVVPTTGSNKPTAVALQEGSVEINSAVAIVDGVAVAALPETFTTGTMILLADTNTEVSVTGGTITGNYTKLKANVSGSGEIYFNDIYTTAITVDAGFAGKLVFNGGVLDNGGRGTGDADAAIYLNSACVAEFNNMTIAASLTKGIKAADVKSITIDNCEFDASKLTIATSGDNSDLQSLSLVDIQMSKDVSTDITIKNSTFVGSIQGATSVPSFVSASGTLADSDTGAAIKIKAENGYELGTVTVTGNKFVNNYRDIVVGTAAYADIFQGTSSRCPANLCENNKITSWTISNNTTTLTSDVVAGRGVATLSHNAITGYNKYTTDVACCGEINNGVAIWVIANCYVNDGGTWKYVKNGTTYTVTANIDGSVTLK